MTGAVPIDAPARSPTRILADIAYVLQFPEDADRRVGRALELLSGIVPYTRCVLFEAQPGRPRRLAVVPESSPEERDFLAARAARLLSQVTEHREHDLPAEQHSAPTSAGAHLAVPLVGVDHVIGLLHVEQASPYDEQHSRFLAVVAAELAAYLAMLELHEDEVRRREELALARAKAEAANRSRDAFLALVSHELRSPLSTILTWARLLSKGTLDPAMAARALATIQRNTRLQAQLIEDLLDVARIDAGKFSLVVGTADLAAIVREVMEDAEPATEATRLEVQMMTIGRGDFVVRGDPARLRQVVTNILGNAIKFTPEGGRIDLSLESLGAEVRFIVRDTGPGIPADFVDRVFDRFAQADVSFAGGQRGLGLGLAIAREIVDLHGGTITAENAGEGHGAILTVRLPRGSSPAGRVPPDEASEQGRS
jgi:signal transduction histidine kinase